MKMIFEILNTPSRLKMRIPLMLTFLFLLTFFNKMEVCAQSTKEFKTSTDTLVVYSDVPGLAASDKYIIRVRSAASNNQWIDVFAHYTYNRAEELGGVSVPRRDGTISIPTVYNYAKHTSAWSHTYGNIEMSKNSPVEVEIAAKNGFKIINRDFFKATVHPAQKASVATLVDGKIYFTVSNPCQLVIDINGQMDDFNAAINPIGSPVHAISIFANPVIKKPSLTNPRTHYVEPGTTLATLKNVNPAVYDTLYFKPGVHDLGQDIKIYPGKVNYIPGDAFIYGNINNKGVPTGGFAKNGEKLQIYGYGTLSGAKIFHEDYVDPPYTVSSKGIEIENASNWKISGVTIVDPANHSVYTIGQSNGLFSYTKVISWRANGDGIGGSEDVVDCFIRTQDDASYAKGNRNRCTFWKDANAALFHMANMPENESTPMIIEDCDVIYARLRTAVGLNGGGFQQRGGGNKGQKNVNAIIRNFRIHDKLTNMPIIHLVSFEGSPDGLSPTLIGSSYKGILFQNVSIAGMASGNKQRILGCAEAPWYAGLIFDNLTIGGTKVTKANHLTYFNTNEFVKYLLFEMPQDLTLNTVADPNKGSITKNPDQATYTETSTVTLSAISKSGYVFSNWSGDITSTTNPIDVVIDKNMTITANFSDPDFTKPLILSAAGSGSITIPAGVTSVTAQVWGGGGAGGSASNDAVASQTRGGGGAGGGYASVTRTVTAGQVLTYTVGAAGIAAPVGFANMSVDPMQNGGLSNVSIDSDVIAQAAGGKGGTNIAGTTTTPQGGSGGTTPKLGNIGTVLYYGGNGGTANSASTGSGGGSAGASGNGGDAVIGSTTGGAAGIGGGAAGGNGINSTNPGNPGKSPGAGGSGAAVRASANTIQKGGDGANGSMILTFVVSNLSTNQAKLDTTVNIYPNPASDKVFFNSKDKEIEKVQLVDLSGKILYKAEVRNQSGSIDLSGIAKGVYLVIMSTESDTITKKISVK